MGTGVGWNTGNALGLEGGLCSRDQRGPTWPPPAARQTSCKSGGGPVLEGGWDTSLERACQPLWGVGAEVWGPSW